VNFLSWFKARSINSSLPLAKGLLDVALPAMDAKPDDHASKTSGGEGSATKTEDGDDIARKIVRRDLLPSQASGLKSAFACRSVQQVSY
jgi:hypothetical protein